MKYYSSKVNVSSKIMFSDFLLNEFNLLSLSTNVLRGSTVFVVCPADTVDRHEYICCMTSRHSRQR
jgi:hypothetical protein